MRNLLKYINNNIHNIIGNMPLNSNDINEDNLYITYWDKRNEDDEYTLGFINRRWKKILSNISDNSTVLDIGCGNGDLLRLISTNKKGCLLTGIDISSKSIELTRSQGFKAIQGKIDEKMISELPSYDYIIMGELIEHLENPEKVILALKIKL